MEKKNERKKQMNNMVLQQKEMKGKKQDTLNIDVKRRRKKGKQHVTLDT